MENKEKDQIGKGGSGNDETGKHGTMNDGIRNNGIEADYELDFVKFVMYTLPIIILQVFLSFMLPINIEITFFLGYVLISVFLSPLIVNSVGILFKKPLIAFYIIVSGALIGHLFSAFLDSYGQDLPFTILAAVFIPGVKVLVISWLKNKKGDGFTLAIGSVVEFFLYIFGGGIYYVLILSWVSLMAVAAIVSYAVMLTLINMIFIPFSLLLKWALKSHLKIEHLEQLMEKKRDIPGKERTLNS